MYRNKNAYSFVYYHSKLPIAAIFLVTSRVSQTIELILRESVCVESIKLLLRWSAIGAFTSCRYNVIIVTIIRAVVRSFPERRNLERPYNVLWALAHNSESVSGRVANEICFDWRTSISRFPNYSFDVCIFPGRFRRRSFESSPWTCPRRKQMQFAYGSVECGHDITVYLSGN